MAGKNSSFRLIGVADIVALLLTACLSALYTSPSVTPKSQDAICRFGPGIT
jgi:hypothetical protein